MRRAGLGALALGLVACGGPPKAPTVHHFTGPAAPRRSVVADRESVSITVYNQNFGLVREVRNVDVGSGKISLEYADVSARIQPTTVHIKSLSAPGALSILEQNYRFDLLTPAKLLEKYVDRRVLVFRWNEKTGRDEEKEAVVLSVAGGMVLKLPEGITAGLPGRIAFPDVPPNLIAKPSLVWLLESTAPKQKLEVTYLTQNLNWQADYVLVLNEDAAPRGDLTGWVTLTNKTGASYENAQLKLVAGDVQKLAELADDMNSPVVAFGMIDKAKAESFKEEGLFEYHLYSLQRPTTLLDNEVKQVALLEAEGIQAEKHFVFQGAEAYFQGNSPQPAKIGVYLTIANRETNHLGMPLPKGIVRVYKADKSGQKQLVGEDRIDHTPRDEELRIKMGEAFDLVGERTRMDWKTPGRCTTESAWEISLRNHKDEAVEIEVREPVAGDWQIVSSSQPFTKKDAHTFVFNVKVGPRAEVKLQYRVRSRTC